MTSDLDVVRAWTESPISDFEAGEAYLSDDFQSVDKNGNVEMNKESWNGMARTLYGSFPDWSYVRSGLRQEGDAVILTGHYEATFTNDLDLSAMGMGVIPASGNRVKTPESSAKVTVEGDQIARLEPYGEGGGLEAFIASLIG